MEKRFGDIAEFINGRAFKPEDWGKKGLPIIRIQNLTGTNELFNYYEGEFNKRHLVKNDDILISWSASLGVYRWDKEDAVLNQHIFKVNLKNGIDKTYFYYAVQEKLIEMGQQVHGSTMKHITKDKFDNLKIPLPDLKTQQKIASILEQADAARQKRKQANQLTEQFLQSAFLEMLGDPVQNEKGWELVLFSEVGSLNRGLSKHRPRNAPFLLGGKYPLIQTGEVANCNSYIKDFTQTYSEEGLKQSKMWKKGTLLITIAANIAKTGILTFDACFPDSIVGFIPNEKTCVEYIQYWLSFVQKTLEENAPESAQKNINLDILRKLKLPLPPLPLQQKFARIVEQVEQLHVRQRESEKELENLFGSLMQRYFG
jgi:type I restriction enzyme S subunit